MQQILELWNKSFNFTYGNFSMPIPYIQAGAIIGLTFLLILVMAQFRRHEVDFSIKGALFGVFFGFLLALILEGFLIVGGKTALTSVLGWKNAPKPLEVALDAGRSQLIQVLGINTQIPSSLAKESNSVQSTLGLVQGLSPTDLKQLKALLCKP